MVESRGDTKKESHVWNLLAWIWLAIGSIVGVWWYFRIPTAGYGGLALAMGATLMPLVWEKVGVLCKMLWLAMLFVLLFAEYRAINKDRRDASAELTQKFGEITTQANNNLKQILDDEHNSFAGMLGVEDDRFAATMTAILNSQRQNQREFASLLAQQRDLFDKQNEMIESMNGHLLPNTDPLPSLTKLGCEDMHTDADDYFILFGNVVNIVHVFPFVLLRIHGANVISFDKLPSGLLALTLDMRDPTGNIVARFDSDGFEVGSTLLKRHPDKSTLIVEDAKGNRILRARYNNPRLLTFETNGTYMAGPVRIKPTLGNPGPNDSTCLSHGSLGININ